MSCEHLLVEIEQGSKFVASGVADVTIGTVQTLSRAGSGQDRLEKFDPRLFKGVIVGSLFKLRPWHAGWV